MLNTNLKVKYAAGLIICLNYIINAKQAFKDKNLF